MPAVEAAAEPARPASFQLEEAPLVLPRETKTVGPHQGLRDVLSVVGVLASALLLAFCLITFVFQSYQVDGPSMQTTLHNRDHLIVWKVPQTVAKLTRHHYIPNRGDVIIFDEPRSASGGVKKQLIKRVIGLPGERVVVKDGILTIYNNDFPNGYSPDKELPYGKVIVTTPGNIDITVKENQIFACGDNRTNSLDSRSFGPIDSSTIVGKLVLRVLPLNSVTRF
jgi:signal peptidase I